MFNRTEIRDALMRVRGIAPVYLIDELVEQLVLAHREHEALMARMRAEFDVEVTAIRREFAALRMPWLVPDPN
jgi:hypothetical protein